MTAREKADKIKVLIKHRPTRIKDTESGCVILEMPNDAFIVVDERTFMINIEREDSFNGVLNTTNLLAAARFYNDRA